MGKQIPQSNQKKNNSHYFDSEEEAIKVLKKEGKRLEYIAKKIWQRNMDDYKSSLKQYVRTGDALKSIKLKGVKVISQTNEVATLGIELTYENDLAYHESEFTKQGSKKKQPEGHAIMLISAGWYAKKLEKHMGKRIDRFTYFEGTGYLYQVYKEFMKTTDKRISLDVQWSGKHIRNKG